MPSVERTIDLGPANIESYDMPHPIALDPQSGRLYVSTSPSRTLIFDAAALSPIGQLSVGGNVSLYPEHDRLYVGVAGSYNYDTGQTIPAELKLFDASTLAFRRSLIFSDTAPSVPPYALVDPSTSKLYIVHSGVYLADADSLEVSDTLSGTLPTPGGLVPNYYAVDAAIDPARQRLYVSRNNGVPGSNNGNTLLIYDLATDQVVGEDNERSTASIAIDRDAGAAYVARGRMDTLAVVKFDANGHALRRLDGVVGQVEVDPARGRVYLLGTWGGARLVVTDLDLNYLGELKFDGIDDSLAFGLDAARDRLLVVTSAGRLVVLLGHAALIEHRQPTPPLPHGAVQWLAPSPDYAHDHLLYAAIGQDEFAGGTLYRTRDDGQTWGFVAGLPVTDSISALAFSPDYAIDQTLFAALGGGSGYFGRGSGVYRSIDGGQTWSPAAHDLTDLTIRQVIVSPDYAHDRTVYASGMRQGLFRSTDGGDTWTRLADRYRLATDYAGASLALSALDISPHFAQDNSLIIARSSGSILLSRDRGDTWQVVAPDFASRLAYAPNPTARSIFAVLGSGGVIRSDDGGEHWLSASAGLDVQPSDNLGDLTSSPLPQARFAAMLLLTGYQQPGRLYGTVDGDQPWQLLNTDPSIVKTAIKLAADTDQQLVLFIGAADGRLYKQPVDGLVVGQSPALSLDEKQVQAIAFAPDNPLRASPLKRVTIVAGGASFGVWLSEDEGRTWRDTGFPGRSMVEPLQLRLSPAYATDGTMFATAGQGLYRSRDRGQTWEVLKIGSGAGYPIGTLAISPNFAADRTLLVGGDYRQPDILQSNDGGDTWTPIDQQIVLTPTAANRLALSPDGAWWVWVDDDGLYRSDDHGQAWKQVFHRSDGVIQSMTVSPDYSQDGTALIGLLHGVVLRTTDAGQTWQSIGQKIFAGDVWSSAVAFSPNYADDRTLFAGTDRGLYRSPDGGQSWVKADAGLPLDNADARILAVAVSPGFALDRAVLAAMTAGGLYVSHDAGQSWNLVGR